MKFKLNLQILFSVMKKIPEIFHFETVRKRKQKGRKLV